jgi:hypothetical protein
MRIRIAGLFLGALLLCGSADGAQMWKIGLIVDTERGGRDQEVLNLATRAFLESRRFSVFERSRLEKIVREQKLQQFTGKDLQVLADLTGIDYLGLIDYEVANEGDVYTLGMTIRVIDVRTGQVHETLDNRTFGARLPLVPGGDGSEKLRRTIATRFPATGYVVRVQGGTVEVDLGSEHGIKEGDSLELLRLGEPSIHPVTGVELPAAEYEIGVLEVVSLGVQVSVCKPKGRKTEVRVGDLARLQTGGALRRLPWGGGR